MLTYAAKFGLSPSVRKALGYHSDVRDSSMMSYSRDRLADPVRRLSEVISQIKSGKFNPDALHGTEEQSSDSSVESSSEDGDSDSEGSRRRTCPVLASALSNATLGLFMRVSWGALESTRAEPAHGL